LDHAIVQTGWTVINQINKRSGSLENLGPLDGSNSRPTLIGKNEEVGPLRTDEGHEQKGNHLASQPLRPHPSENGQTRFH
jgi:hypothetical protein